MSDHPRRDFLRLGAALAPAPLPCAHKDHLHPDAARQLPESLRYLAQFR